MIGYEDGEMTKGRCEFSNIQIVILIIIFFASMNFLGKYFYCIFLAFGLMILTSMRIRVDHIIPGLIMLSGFYIILHPDYQMSILLSLKKLSYPMCYLLGYNFIHLGKINDVEKPIEYEKKIVKSILCVALGSFSHYFLNMLYNPMRIARNTMDIWTGQSMAATGQTTLAILALSFFVALIFCNTRFVQKIIAIVGILVIYAYNFILGGRTLILIGVLLFLVSLLFIALNERRVQCFFVQLLVIVLLYCFILLIVKNNWFDIADNISNSNLGMRFKEQNFFDDTRFIIKKEYLDLVLEFPFGGDLIYSHVGMYAHDILLDTYNDVGIFGIIPLVTFLFLSIREWIKAIINNGYSDFFRLLLLCTLISVMFAFFIEPIFAGSPWLFCSYCFFCGIITASNNRVILEGRIYK